MQNQAKSAYSTWNYIGLKFQNQTNDSAMFIIVNSDAVKTKKFSLEDRSSDS